MSTPTDALIEKMARDDYIAKLKQLSVQADNLSPHVMQYVLRDLIDLMIARAAYSAEHEEDGK